LKDKGKLSITTNLNGHWKEFYQVFYASLKQIGKSNLIEKLEHEESHRGNLQSVSELFIQNGFKITKSIEENYVMKFVDGTAFLNHHFVKLGWLSSWTNLFSKEDLQDIFTVLQNNLNIYSQENDGLNLTVPMLFIEGEKQ
jgi:hypothetical protein